MNRIIKVGVGGLIALGLTAGTLGAVFAADPTPTPTPQPGTGGQSYYGCPGYGLGLGGFGMMGGYGMMGGFGAGLVDNSVAQLLGLAQTEIQQQLQAGKSLAQIAADKNVSEDTLVSTILAPRKAALDQNVKNGYLTQAQADLMYQNMQAQAKAYVEATNVGSFGPRFGSGNSVTPTQPSNVGPGYGMMGRGRFSRF